MTGFSKPCTWLSLKSADATSNIAVQHISGYLLPWRHLKQSRPCSLHTCHFLTMEHILSRVRSIPWKLVRQFLPWTSSVISLNLRKATSSFCRSARLTSNTRPFSPSEAISVLWNKIKHLLLTLEKYYSNHTLNFHLLFSNSRSCHYYLHSSEVYMYLEQDEINS